MVKSSSISLAKQLTGNKGEEPGRCPFSLEWKMPKLTSTVRDKLFRLTTMIAGISKTQPISLLWCNIQKRGAQPNHYDLLRPIEEEATKDTNFKEKFIDNHDALQF
eukprot:10407864-Heterocapsa_arctica.AAC.1